MSERRYMVGHGWIDPPTQKQSPAWLTNIRQEIADAFADPDEEADEDDSVIDDEDLPQW